MAPQAGAGGMSDQEQKYVKMVRQFFTVDDSGQVLKLLAGTIRHGIMSGQVHHGRRNGFRLGRRVWIVHVKCTFPLLSL